MRETNIDFMGMRWITAAVSIVSALVSIGFLIFSGLNLGLDFTGGTLVEAQFAKPTDPATVRSFLEQQGFKGGVVQYFGAENELMIRMPPQKSGSEANLGNVILKSLQGMAPDVRMLQANYVGPAVGAQLRDTAGLALLAALGGVLVYVLVRFTKQVAVGGVVALIHDVIIVMGCFAVFRWTFDLSVLAAVLAVVGYSINDTIVVADRIRENFRLLRRASTFEVINRSINQTLDRTLATSGTVLLVLIALLIAGGEALRGFALALTIGVVVGTYSSVYVSAAIMMWMGMSREDLIVPERESGAERP